MSNGVQSKRCEAEIFADFCYLTVKTIHVSFMFRRNGTKRQKRNALRDLSRRWKDGVVPYQLSYGFSEFMEMITSQMKDIALLVLPISFIKTLFITPL